MAADEQVVSVHNVRVVVRQNGDTGGDTAKMRPLTNKEMQAAIELGVEDSYADHGIEDVTVTADATRTDK